MKTLNLVTKLVVGMVVVVLLAGMWVMPAAAQAPERSYIRLEYGLKLALVRVDALQDRVDTANAYAGVAAQFIADEQAQGFDTSQLEIALATLQTEIDEAQTLHDSAAQLLAEKDGFDGDGKVVDPEKARDTLKNAYRTIQDADQTLRLARQEFRQAMRDYLEAKRQNR
jgi:hypothetical protein